mmetsp:Transcript_4529/g.16078  ORF Transcript_4529/g.16078 Transcript_4529/m.16078 type:complete len:316 (-) Transcript_4529:758-1705(-)
MRRLDSSVPRQRRHATHLRRRRRRRVGGDGEGKLPGLETRGDASDVRLGVRPRQRQIRVFHRAVREPILRGDVDRGKLLPVDRAVDAVHAVPARLEDVVVDRHVRKQRRDAALLRRRARRHERLRAEEVLRVRDVEVRHAHLERDGRLEETTVGRTFEGERVRRVVARRRRVVGILRDVVRGDAASLPAGPQGQRPMRSRLLPRLLRGVSRAVVVREVHVPLHAAQLAAEDETVPSVRPESAEVALKHLGLLVEVSPHGLLVREQKRRSSVFAPSGLHPDRRRVFEHERDRVEELGGAARLEDELRGKDEEGRLA